MKTSMQEAIELVKKYDNREISMKVLFYNLELLQEKEKEQIIKAMSYSTYREMKGINVSNEEYYNQTYKK